jgi:hypothetical protein
LPEVGWLRWLFHRLSSGPKMLADSL